MNDDIENSNIKLKGLSIEMEEIEFSTNGFKIKSPKVTLKSLEFSPIYTSFPIVNVLDQIKSELEKINQPKDQPKENPENNGK